MAEQKGITYLLQAMPQVLVSYPDVTLVIVGDGEIKAELQKETIRLGIEQNVHFLGTRLDIPELLRLFNIYVLPSIWEGMPLVLLEAMAAGCPVIATNVGGVSKVIKNKHNGLLVDSKNPNQLASAIKLLLSDKELRSEYSRNGINTFQEHFSAEIMTRQYEKLYLRA